MLSQFSQNYYRNLIKRIRKDVFYRGSGFATKTGNGEGSEPSHQKLSPPPFLYDSPYPSIDCSPNIGKKIAFKQISPNILPLMHIFIFTIMTYLKSIIGIESLSTK